MLVLTLHTHFEQVELPPAVKWLLSLFAIGISFGLHSISSVLECLNMRGYIATLALYIATPIVLALLILLIALAHVLSKCRCSRKELLETAVPPLLHSRVTTRWIRKNNRDPSRTSPRTSSGARRGGEQGRLRTASGRGERKARAPARVTRARNASMKSCHRHHLQP